jgi:hypothetical protein
LQENSCIYRNPATLAGGGEGGGGEEKMNRRRNNGNSTAFDPANYPWTEMPEKVTMTRPRTGTPKALAGWKTLPSNWLATWVRMASSCGPLTMV